MEDRIFLLSCEVQQYAWGKIGSNSEVARLSKSFNPNFIVKEDEPYAELWMGAHVKAPSKIPSKENISLLDYLKNNKNLLGDKIKEEFKGELPYLFKVLSVNKSLSIQAHPNKKHAEELHEKFPEIYKDPNHKPEMAIALTQFEGLCGFRPKHEIVNFIEVVPEFKTVIGSDAAAKFATCKDEDVSKYLKLCFENVIKCDKSILKSNINTLQKRLTGMERDSSLFKLCNGSLFLRLSDQFAGDVGCFIIYFLNLVQLKPGEAMYLGANEPHAYLDGNCVECMACSDNVVRAGLTPKLIDAPTLCNMLTYKPAPAETKKFLPISQNNDKLARVFRPPVNDFAVIEIEVPSSEKLYTLAAQESASIVLVISGCGHLNKPKIKLLTGSVLFIAATTEVELNIEGGFHAFRALSICD